MDNNYQQQNGMERELGWDDTIQQEQEYITLPAGDYDFRVERFEREDMKEVKRFHHVIRQI